MRFDTDTRTRIYLDVETSIDPGTSTVELKVDDTWHPAAWEGAATQSGGTWKRTARTTGYFAGPGVTTPGGATVLTSGLHRAKTRIVTATETLAEDADPIHVD